MDEEEDQRPLQETWTEKNTSYPRRGKPFFLSVYLATESISLFSMGETEDETEDDSGGITSCETLVTRNDFHHDHII